MHYNCNYLSFYFKLVFIENVSSCTLLSSACISFYFYIFNCTPVRESFAFKKADPFNNKNQAIALAPLPHFRFANLIPHFSSLPPLCRISYLNAYTSFFLLSSSAPPLIPHILPFLFKVFSWSAPPLFSSLVVVWCWCHGEL